MIILSWCLFITLNYLYCLLLFVFQDKGICDGSHTLSISHSDAMCAVMNSDENHHGSGAVTLVKAQCWGEFFEIDLCM